MKTLKFLSVLIILMICTNARAEQVTAVIDGLRYLLNDGNAQVARQDKSLSGDIVIPEKVSFGGNDYTVNGIVYPTNTATYGGHTSISAEGGAFQGSSITSVTIPKTITTLSPCAFINCTKLQKVYLPETLTSIGFGCFAYCSSLTDVVLPSNVSSVSEWAFGGCTSLKNINIPEKLTTLSRAVFYNSRLEEVTIPATIRQMVEGCLSVSTLKKVTIYVRDITRISYTESCFGNVSNTELYVPEGSKYIYQEYYPWREFKNIVEFDDGHVGEPINPLEMMITFDGLRYKITDDGYAQVAQQDNSTLSGDIVIPEKVSFGGNDYTVNGIVYPTNTATYGGHTSISAEGGAFQGSSITSVTIPKTITTLSPCAFINCTKLQKVYLPETLTSIGFGCFAYCSSLTDVVLPSNVSSVSEWAFGGCTSLKNINIPEKLTTLSRAVFYNSRLEEVTIPATIRQMVEGCLSVGTLKKVYIHIEDITKISYTESCFGFVNNTSLYVPLGSKKIYQEYYPWRKFKEIIESEEITATIETARFKNNFAFILSKTIETIYAEDKNEIEVALAAYYSLTEMAQAQLQPEKDHLDSLMQKVNEIISGIDHVTIDSDEKVSIFTLTGLKVQSTQKGHVYIVNGKKVLIK